MNGNNEIKFSLTEQELMEFSEKLFKVTIYCRRKIWLLSMFPIILGISVVPFLVSFFLYSFIGGEEVFWAPLFIVVFLVVWFVLTYPRTLYRGFERAGFLKERAYRIQDGLLYYNGTETITPCCLYTHTYRTRKLILVGRELSKDNMMLIPIPKRCFEGEEEIDAFLDNFRNPVQAQVKEHPCGGAFNYYFTLDPDSWVHIYTQMTQLDRTADSTSRRASILVLMIMSVAGVIYSIIHALVFHRYIMIFFMICFAGAASRLVLHTRRTYDEAHYRKMFEKNKLPVNGAGNWEIAFMEDKIRILSQETLYDCKWSGFNRLAETADTFFLLHTQKAVQSNVLPVPKWLFKSREEQEGFAAFCVRHGARLENMESLSRVLEEAGSPKPDQTTRKKQRRSMAVLVAMALLFTLSVLVLSPGLGKMRPHLPVQEMPWKEERESAFNPAEYPDYIPLEVQVEVLKSMGIDGLDSGIVEEQKRWIEKDAAYRALVEGDPYYILLSSIGAGEYNQEKQEWKAVSKTVYWFDFEGRDISYDYIDILNGIQGISNGELLLSHMSEDTGKVDWDKGTGTIEVTFTLNGRAYSYTADVDNDWIDPELIGYLNNILKENGIEKRVYSMGDNGQGAILFYKTEKWADEFKQKTGIKLEKND